MGLGCESCGILHRIYSLCSSKPIDASSLEYNNIVLPLLSQPSMIDDIIVALTGRSTRVKMTKRKLSFIMTMTAGHPRLLESLFSVASALRSTPQSSKLRTFFPAGFKAFLDNWRKDYWDIAAEAWKATDRFLPTILSFLKS